MKKIIMLIRHARPDFPGGKYLCLGRNTDIGICAEGVRKAEELRDRLKDEIAQAGVIYTSPLLRARETAAILAEGRSEIRVCDGLTEMDVGEWDGLDFDTISTRYKELYDAREYDLSIAPPGGEEFPDASIRMRRTLGELARSSEKSTLIAVSHSGIIRAFLCDVFGVDYKDNRTIPLEYTENQNVVYDTETDSFYADQLFV